jgi:hypothetical protein
VQLADRLITEPASLPASLPARLLLIRRQIREEESEGLQKPGLMTSIIALEEEAVSMVRTFCCTATAAPAGSRPVFCVGSSSNIAADSNVSAKRRSTQLLA